MQAELIRSGRSILGHSSWDALLVALAMGHGSILLLFPSIPTIALGLWWNANTIAHNFIHLPFFRAKWLNASFSIYLSLVQGCPQTLWRDRHLAHHASRPWRLHWSAPLITETVLVVLLWSWLAATMPGFFLTVYLPGYVLGLTLCQLQGHYEHARGTISHYGAAYNWFFFNDGYHREHHARPALHWKRLASLKDGAASASRWPPVLRWLDGLNLNALEKMVLRSTWLQRFVLSRHEQAFRVLLPHLTSLRRITVVGGGLFPRTTIILRRLVPTAEVTVIESNIDHIRLAGPYLDGEATFVHSHYDSAACKPPVEGTDLIIIPLAFHGDRTAIYRRPPARYVLVHDWIWKRRSGLGAVVSMFLLKRINLIQHEGI